ncbi:dTMP kinase [Thermosipho ferrireducens]|uniref:Thymidylate kinase n=1 Tax=Thermosipho ferrireducens TaxID=2571116 RepID=A0ABX7SBH2_9BACT|nr:dTMP kinase [Thermosipho ferrireducens]QTA38898.1 dTMP kinase [Thermosipho ferrireducens]
MFIAFEGIDGCGKSTQLDLFYDYLVKSGFECIKVREPGGTILGEKVRRILLDKEMRINSRSELLLFLASRAQLIEEIIKPSLEKGYYVLADRFADSSIAYQGAGRNLGEVVVEKLNAFATDNIFPDIVFYIDIPVKEALRRIESKSKDRIEREGENYLRVVREAYLSMANKRENFYILDGTKSIEEIHNEIVNLYKSFKPSP